MDRQCKMDKARDLFLQGYNCAQAVAGAFALEMGLTEDAVLRMASGFGGGLGGLRMTCGAVSGMALVYSALRGYDDPEDMEAKKTVYGDVKRLCAQFDSRFGTLICRELLARNPDWIQTARQEGQPEYCITRPCCRYVEACAALLCDELK